MLKRVFAFMLAVISFGLFLGLTGEVSAIPAEVDGLMLTPEGEEEREDFSETYSLTLLEEEPKVMPIRCFDVREDGCVALGFEDGNTKTICVYSTEREFLYGYTFSAYGSFYIFWEKEYVCVYFVRGEAIAKLDRDGNCMALGTPVKTSTFYNLQDHFESPSKQLGDVTYSLKNDMIIGSDFGRLVMTYPDGTESVFYDANKLHNSSVLFYTVCVTLFSSCLIWGYIRQEKMRKEQGGGNYTPI